MSSKKFSLANRLIWCWNTFNYIETIKPADNFECIACYYYSNDMSLIKLIEFLHVNLESVIHQYVHKIVHIFNNIWIIVRRVVYTCMRKKIAFAKYEEWRAHSLCHRYLHGRINGDLDFR